MNKPGSRAWTVGSRTTPIWSARSISFLAGCDCCETKGRTRPTLRSGCGWIGRPCQPGWPVDRTALAVGSRNPPRRLRTDSSMRSVVGISGLQAGEDVKIPVCDSFSPFLKGREELRRCTARLGMLLLAQLADEPESSPWSCSHWAGVKVRRAKACRRPSCR